MWVVGRFNAYIPARRDYGGESRAPIFRKQHGQPACIKKGKGTGWKPALPSMCILLYTVGAVLRRYFPKNDHKTPGHKLAPALD